MQKGIESESGAGIGHDACVGGIDYGDSIQPGVEGGGGATHQIAEAPGVDQSSLGSGFGRCDQPFFIPYADHRPGATLTRSAWSGGAVLNKFPQDSAVSQSTLAATKLS